jgi:hypothetical protein
VEWVALATYRLVPIGRVHFKNFFFGDGADGAAKGRIQAKMEIKSEDGRKSKAKMAGNQKRRWQEIKSEDGRKSKAKMAEQKFRQNRRVLHASAT